MQYEVLQDKKFPQDWHAEAIDAKEGDCFVVIFGGPNAEQRAREYADWKNVR